MSKRACVKCGADLQSRMVGAVEVDLCGSCGGLWLDASELQQLAEMTDEELSSLRALVEEGPAAPYRTPGPIARSDEQRLDLPCPACSMGKLTRAVVGTTSVELCSGCAGAFLDPGELDQMTAAVRGRKEKLATIAAMSRSVRTRGTIGG